MLPADFAILKDSDGGAGNVSQAHKFRNLFFELSRGEVACGSGGVTLRVEGNGQKYGAAEQGERGEQSLRQEESHRNPSFSEQGIVYPVIRVYCPVARECTLMLDERFRKRSARLRFEGGLSMSAGKQRFLILGLAAGLAVMGGCSKSDTEKLERDAKATGKDLQKTASDAADAAKKAANEAADKAQKAADEAKKAAEEARKAAEKAKAAAKDATKKTN